MAVCITKSTSSLLTFFLGKYLRYENNIGVSDFKEYPDEYINSPVNTEISLHDQASQLVLDCSSLCSSDESGALLEVDVRSCLDTCSTKG